MRDKINQILISIALAFLIITSYEALHYHLHDIRYQDVISFLEDGSMHEKLEGLFEQNE